MAKARKKWAEGSEKAPFPSMMPLIFGGPVACAFRFGLAPEHPYKQGCGAYFSDLEPPPRPPDLPAVMQAFKLIKGDKK